MRICRSTRRGGGRLLDWAVPLSTTHSMTMRRLLLFRHAKAERSEPGMEDRSTPAGGARPKGCRQHRRLYGDPCPDTRPGHDIPGGPHTGNLEIRGCRIQAGTGRVIRSNGFTTPRPMKSSTSSSGPRRTHKPPHCRPQPRPARTRLMLVASGDIETRERCARKLPTCGLGHHRFRLRRMGKTASSIRAAGALHNS